MGRELPYDDFLTLYERLQRQFGSPDKIRDPEGLTAGQEKTLQEIYRLTHEHDFEKAFAGRQKVVDYVPSGMRRAWPDYLYKWSHAVDCYIDAKNGIDTRLYFPPTKPSLRKPDPSLDSEFYPLHHDGSALSGTIESILVEQYQSRRQECESEGGDPFCYDKTTNLYGLMSSYIDFLRNDLCLDFAGMERRWRMVPLFFRPKHVSQQDMQTGYGLNANVRDAITAFISGAPKAALALCRASLETIIKDLYLPGKKHGERPSLKKLLDVASKDNNFIQTNLDRILALKEVADRALHRNMSSSEIHSEETEHAIVQFMEIISLLIEEAPKQSGDEQPV